MDSREKQREQHGKHKAEPGEYFFDALHVFQPIWV